MKEAKESKLKSNESKGSRGKTNESSPDELHEIINFNE